MTRTLRREDGQALISRATDSATRRRAGRTCATCADLNAFINTAFLVPDDN